MVEQIAVRPFGREVAIWLFVQASDCAEKWIPFFGPMLWLAFLLAIGVRRRRSFRVVPLGGGLRMLIPLASAFGFSIQIPGIDLVAGEILGAVISV